MNPNIKNQQWAMEIIRIVWIKVLNIKLAIFFVSIFILGGIRSKSA